MLIDHDANTKVYVVEGVVYFSEPIRFTTYLPVYQLFEVYFP